MNEFGITAKSFCAAPLVLVVLDNIVQKGKVVGNLLVAL